MLLKLTPVVLQYGVQYGFRPIDCFLKVFQMYDGNNSTHVLNELAKEGLFHTPIPGATSFAAGSCSVEEMDQVKSTLHPPEEKIIRAYLIDVVEDEHGQTRLKLRDVDSKNIYTTPVEPGSFIINCTSHIANLTHEPVLSCNGRVRTISNYCIAPPLF